MARLVLATLLVLISFIPVAARITNRGTLPFQKLVLILDPGHGGLDPGSQGIFRGQLVVEDEYVYDVAKRVEAYVKARGGTVHLTIKDPDPRSDQPRNWPARDVFPNEKTEVFALDGELVRAGQVGLVKRIIYANKIWARYKSDPSYKVVFISIHFDSVGSKSIEGVRIIMPENTTPKASLAILEAFSREKRLRENPLIHSRDRDHGMRRLYILRDHNSVAERILIELGNFSNERDVWRIRDPLTRIKYAKTIVAGLEQFLR